MGGVSDIFVERIKLYHNLTVQENCIFFCYDADHGMKISEDSGKKVDPNSAAQLFFVPNSATAILMPNYEILVIFCP
jgi:hypothetical protein